MSQRAGTRDVSPRTDRGQVAFAAASAPRTPTHVRLAVGVIAALPGMGVMSQAMGGVPMSLTAVAVALPAAIALAAIAVFGPRWAGWRGVTRLLRQGATAGLVATAAYDAVRPPLRWAMGFTYDPFRAVLRFGELITDRPASNTAAIVAGWTYHALDGLSFGVMFALVCPQGGALAGIAFAMLLQSTLMISYPRLVGVSIGDPGFLTLGFAGHLVFGAVLGAVLRARAVRE